VRLLLDAHYSPKRVGGPLRRDGHDVLALAEEQALEALADAQVLELGVDDRRIVVTRNAKHFTPLLRTWAGAGRHHEGCILMWTVPHDHYAETVRRVREALDAYPAQAEWRDLVVAP
jgi:hypothetical protein